MEEAARASFEKALVEEQRSNVLMSPLRATGPLAGLGVILISLWLGDVRLSRAVLPVWSFYTLYSVGLILVRRFSRGRIQLLHAIAVVDVPTTGVFGFVWARAMAPATDWPCGWTLAYCMFLISGTCFLLDRRLLATTTIASILVVLLLFQHFGQSWGITAIAVAILVFTGAAGRNMVDYAMTLVRRSRDEAEQRVTEVSQLNDELRRQVAERSRELTEALANSEGSVSPAALDVGDTFDGRYRVVRALGRGGMGAVYEVERTRDGRKLALKVVTAALQAKQAARFAREAEIGARLQHENLVSIVDVGIAAGSTPFLVMELVQGGSLEDKRARFGVPKWARPILRQIAAGLAELHAHNVVHRDLKPGNVLLVENGGGAPVAKISDFGISRFGAIDDGGEVGVEGATVHPGSPSSRPRDLTETGALMGTPVYMPPEAWLGAARHASADVFSFGVLAYEALTGRSPFAVPPVLLVRSRQPIPTPAPLNGVDASVAAVVLACLRVEPSERPKAKDVAESLGQVDRDG